MTSEPTQVRLPAEWEACFDSVMIAWPHAATDWADILPEVTATYVSLVGALHRAGMKLLIVTPRPDDVRRELGAAATGEQTVIAEVATNDTWTRDYGPITIEKEGATRLLDFRFNAWGLKFAADKDNCVNRRLKGKRLWRRPLMNRQGFVLEGGSIESDGRGTLLTTTDCLLSPNRNDSLDRGQIERYLMEELGVAQVLWLDYGALIGDDTDSHIDTLARLAPHDTIVYCGAGDSGDPQSAGLRQMARQLACFSTLEGKPYNLIELPLPDPIYAPDGERLPATYANYLATPRAILMPSYGQPRNDRLAADMLRMVYHDREILTVDCRPLIRQHGSLHCATMQLPANALPI